MDEAPYDGENCSHGENVVEVGYYVVGIMEDDI